METKNEVKPRPAIECECISWANENLRASFLGNGHHYGCPKFVPNTGAFELLSELVTGIRYWASQEDGVPDEIWEPFKRAVFITEGKVLNDDEQR